MSVDPVTLGVKVALAGASMAMTMSQKFEGPRLKTLEVTTADYGTPFPEVDGYCRIDGCPVSWAEQLREKKVDSKTKGGKFSNYKYYFTCRAVAAGHEVDGIPRIWMDRHLVFDLTSKGPVSVAAGFFQGLSSDSPVKLTNGRNMRIYLGTETQEIDPRYEAWCEDRYGADSATACRGIANVVFEDVPAEKFGNRIPQISMGVVNNPDPAYLFDTITPGGAIGPVFSYDRTRALFHNTSDESYAIWDVPTLSKLIEGSIPGGTVGDVEEITSNETGDWWVLGGTLGDNLRLVSPDAQFVKADIEIGYNGDRLTGLGNRAYMRINSGFGTGIILCDTTGCTLIDDVDFVPEMFAKDLDGNHWAIGMDGTDIRLYCVQTTEDHTVASPGGVTGFHSLMFNSDGDLFVIVNTTAIVIDGSSFAVIDSASIGGNASRHFNVMCRMLPGSASFFTETIEVNASTLATSQSYTLTDWTSGNTNMIAYEPSSMAIWGSGPGGGGTVTVRYMNRVSASGVTLGSIVQSKCLRRGIPSDAFDVSELTQTVLGYWTIQGTGADQLAPVLDIHDVDAVPHDYGIYFKVKGDASDALIDSSEFHAKEGNRFDISMVPESRIPVRVEFNYADDTADQQPNTASDDVPFISARDQTNKKTFDLTTFVDVPDDAQPKVNRYLRRQWFERELGEATLDVTYGRLEPGDVKTVDIDGEQRVVRFNELTRSGLLLQAKWVRDDPRVHDVTAQAGPTFDGREEDAIFVPSPTKAQILEIPFLNDNEDLDRPLLHYGAGNYGGGNFPGAIFWEGAFSIGEYEQWNAVDSAEKAVWGYCLDVLPAPATPWLWDRASSIQVLVRGTLTSATEAEINADPTINQAIIGNQDRWEIVNFTTATLLGDDVWEISGFLRGRRGTEWACSLHAAGDEFWLADDLKVDAYGLSSVGTTATFKGQTLGRDPIGAPEINVTLSGDTLKPYAPANLSAERDPTDGKWVIRGRRRTRIGGAWTGGTPIPLSEASEAYEVLILNGEGAEVRSLSVTIEGDGNFSAEWDEPDQEADFGSPQQIISAVSYQLSDAVGRGFPAYVEATGPESSSSIILTVGAVAAAANANVTPSNPAHDDNDTLLCIVICKGVNATASCATAGWSDASGVTNPVSLNQARMWLFENECATGTEPSPAITISGGEAAATIVAAVVRIPSKDRATNFGLGTVSSNASSGSVTYAQNSPSIDDDNVIIAIGVHNNDYISGGEPGVITGVTAGLNWTQLVTFATTLGGDLSFFVDYAHNDSGSAYTAGTSGVKTPTYSVNDVSSGVYLEAPIDS